MSRKTRNSNFDQILERLRAHFFDVAPWPEVEGGVLVTKYGKPIAKLVPLDIADDVDPLEAFRFPGVMVVGDIESPLYTDAELDEFEQASVAQLNDPS